MAGKSVQNLCRIQKNSAQNLQVMHTEFSIFRYRILRMLGLPLHLQGIVLALRHSLFLKLVSNYVC